MGPVETAELGEQEVVMSSAEMDRLIEQHIATAPSSLRPRASESAPTAAEMGMKKLSCWLLLAGMSLIFWFGLLVLIGLLVNAFTLS